MKDRRLVILVALLLLGVASGLVSLIVEPTGMRGNLAAEVSGAFFGAGLIESLLLLEDRRRSRSESSARQNALDVSVEERLDSVFLHVANVSDQRVSGLVFDVGPVLGPPIPSEFCWRLVDEEDFDAGVALEPWSNVAVDPPNLSILAGRAAHIELGYTLRHGFGAGGIVPSDLPTTAFVNIHWQFAGDPRDYATSLGVKLIDAVSSD